MERDIIITAAEREAAQAKYQAFEYVEHRFKDVYGIEIDAEKDCRYFYSGKNLDKAPAIRIVYKHDMKGNENGKSKK